MSEHRPLAYAVDINLLSGVPPTQYPTDCNYLEWHATLPATPAFTLDEMRHLLTHGRLVPHHTYSMQQSDFARAGFEVTKDPWEVRLPPDMLVVGIGTRDRYGIFGRAQTTDGGTFMVITYESVDEWRAGRDEREAWA